MSNPGALLAVIRELRSALEHPVPYPGRPGKTRSDLSEDRAEDIRKVFFHAIHDTPDELPLGVEMRLTDLLDDLHNLQFREVEDPNGLDRRALNLVREIEAALLSFSNGPPPPNATQQSEGRTPEGVPKLEAETRVSDWLLKNAKDDPASVTRDAVAAGTGVSAGGVSNTSAWQAFRDRRDAEAKPGERNVPLSDRMQAAIPADCATPDELAELIEEQEAERAKEERRHKRRHKPS